MPRGYPNSDMSTNWNAQWLPYLYKVAINVVRLYPGTPVDKNELVNHAWINSVRRMPPDTPAPIVGKLAGRSMQQYINGKRRNGRTVQRPSMHTHDFACDHSDWLSTERPRYTYDDVDHMLTILRRMDSRSRLILLARLRGRSLVDIAAELGISNTRVCQIIKQDIEPYFAARRKKQG